MIYILHGDNLVASRKTLENLQKKHSAQIRTEFNVADTTSSEFSNICRSVDMFGGIQFIVLDITGAGRTNIDGFADVLKGIPKQNVVVILSGKELGKTNAFIKATPELGAVVLVSKEFESSNVFKFADNVFAGNRTGAYKELRKLENADQEPFYIFSMLLYQLRNVAYAKFNSPLFNKISPFVKDKAKKMAEKYDEEGIKAIYQAMYRLDKDAKYGAVSQDLFIPMAVEAVFKYQLSQV